jgi:V-type H+-transporting ATPase subunit a
MGFFSTFCGFIYNDFAASPIYLTSSCADTTVNKTDSCVYPIGIDPIWHSSSNHMQFINSYKMKFAIIIGVIHMLTGIIFKGANALFNHLPIDFFFEFLPQLVFMFIFFGYICLMILIKWCTDWTFVKQAAPSLITQIINIPIKNGDPGPMPLYGEGTSQIVVNRMILCKVILFNQ